MKLKNTNNHFLPILLTILLLFTSCSPQTSGTIEVEESDTEHTKAIQETATPTPTAAPTPEPTATPVPKVEGISFNEETGEVILSNFGEKVFSNCSDYEIIGENKVSFYCEEQGGKCVYDNGSFTSTYPEINIPRAGITPAQYPTFENKEAVLSYFIDQGDIVAKMIVDGKIKVPFNDDGELVFSDELKQHAKEAFTIFNEEHVSATEKIVYYQVEYMNKKQGSGDSGDPYLFELDREFAPFAPENYVDRIYSKLLPDYTEGHTKSQNEISAYKGISMTFLLGAFYDGEITSDNQKSLTKYIDRFSKITAAMEKFRFVYTQEAFDEVVNLLENDECPIAIISLANIYWSKLVCYPEVDTPSGTVWLGDIEKNSLTYRGYKDDIISVMGTFGSVLDTARLMGNYTNGSDFKTTFEDVEYGLPFPKPNENSAS